MSNTDSREIRRLSKKWVSGTGWPKRLEWLEIHGLRGWTGQRIELNFPIVAIVGENGSGKSTIIQSAASIYQDGTNGKYASAFFPSTAWDNVEKATVRYGYKEGSDNKVGSIRKPTSRWLGNSDRPERYVSYVDLSRIQPVSARVGYAKIAKTKHREISAENFNDPLIARLSSILGRSYSEARMALCDVDSKRPIIVLTKNSATYSGFHQGAGETTVAELLEADMPKYSLILIDEIESSLHPRAQRRLIRDLASKCREDELQIILTTHSPYILDELPLEARLQIIEPSSGIRGIVKGVSPEFAMSKMDDEPHPECDIYVEDNAAKVMISEILAYHAKHLFPRCAVIPYGAASVGQALGQMSVKSRFPRPTCVFLDGDNADAPGCYLLPGDDAPERVVFQDLKSKGWGDIWARIGRDTSEVTDACDAAMTLTDHHDWTKSAANRLFCGGDNLWQSMCAEWAKQCYGRNEADKLIEPIETQLD